MKKEKGRVEYKKEEEETARQGKTGKGRGREEK